MLILTFWSKSSKERENAQNGRKTEKARERERAGNGIDTKNLSKFNKLKMVREWTLSLENTGGR